VIVAGFRRLGARLATAAADPDAGTSENTRRTTLVVATVTVAALAIAWVATYLVLQRPVAAAIPFAYQIATALGLLAVRSGRGFKAFRTSQIGMKGKGEIEAFFLVGARLG
jgi:hypothetical protein